MKLRLLAALCCLLTGCVTSQTDKDSSNPPSPAVKSRGASPTPVTESNAFERKLSRLAQMAVQQKGGFVKITNLPPGVSPRLRDDVRRRFEAHVDAAHVRELQVLDEYAAAVNRLGERADKFTRERTRFSIVGSAFTVATVALSAANAPANAVWIASLGAGATSVLSLHTARAEEGFTRRTAERQQDDLTRRFETAWAHYSAQATNCAVLLGTATDDQVGELDRVLSIAGAALEQAFLAIHHDVIFLGTPEEVAATIASTKEAIAIALDRARTNDAWGLVRKIEEKLKQIGAAQVELDKKKKSLTEAEAALAKAPDDAALKEKVANAQAAVAAAQTAFDTLTGEAKALHEQVDALLKKNLGEAGA